MTLTTLLTALTEVSREIPEIINLNIILPVMNDKNRKALP